MCICEIVTARRVFSLNLYMPSYLFKSIGAATSSACSAEGLKSTFLTTKSTLNSCGILALSMNFEIHIDSDEKTGGNGQMEALCYNRGYSKTNLMIRGATQYQRYVCRFCQLANLDVPSERSHIIAITWCSTSEAYGIYPFPMDILD